MRDFPISCHLFVDISGIQPARQDLHMTTDQHTLKKVHKKKSAQKKKHSNKRTHTQIVLAIRKYTSFGISSHSSKSDVCVIRAFGPSHKTSLRSAGLVHGGGFFHNIPLTHGSCRRGYFCRVITGSHKVRPQFPLPGLPLSGPDYDKSFCCRLKIIDGGMSVTTEKNNRAQ